MIIGTFVDGRSLEYDEALYQFSIGQEPVSLAQIRAYDAAGQISWNIKEQREWMVALDEVAFIREHEKATGNFQQSNSYPQQQIPQQNYQQTQQQSQPYQYQQSGPVPPNAQYPYMQQQVPPQDSQKPKSNTTKIVLIVVACVAAFLLLCCCTCGYGFTAVLDGSDSAIIEELEDSMDRYGHSSLTFDEATLSAAVQGDVVTFTNGDGMR